MDYPATQMFVSDNEDVDEDEDDEISASPLGAEKNVKVGVLIVDSFTYPVHKGVNKVGRIESSSIVIDHNTISKEHAEIEAGVGSKSIFISDLGSLNKTKLNDITLRPEKMYQLQDGDALRFGLVQAIFKLEEKKAEEAKSIVNDFVIPETPVSTSKEISTIIPGTPDLSFEDALASRSLTEGNNSSDISLITGTQQEKERSIMSGITVCNKDLEKGEISMRSESTPKIDRKNTAGNSLLNDISAEFETRKNISATDSDEDNIFEMMTQKSNVHEEETQKFGTDPALESRFSSINDLETQKFGHEDTPKSHVQSINDLETQKFELDDTPESRVQFINDLETQKFGPDETPQSRFQSINDLETQKFFVQNVSRKSLKPGISNGMKESISDADKQKYPSVVIAASDDEGSETDEEGLFEDSGGGHDMFDAPTQLIISPDKEGCTRRRAALEISFGVTQAKLCKDPANEKRPAFDEEEDKEEEELKRRVNNGEGDAVQAGTSGGQTLAAQSAVEKSVSPNLPEEVKNKAGLNDSIENKLNNMFDDVNESMAEEPTQMLTQHLERVLECSQVDRPLESDKDSGEVLEDCDTVENLESKKSAKRKDEAIEQVFRIPEIMSTQELFADLPMVNIGGTSKKKDPPSTAAKPSDVVSTASPSQRPKKFESETVKTVSEQPQSRKKSFRDSLNKFRVTEAPESVDPVVSVVPKSSRKSTGTKSLDLKSSVMKLGEIVAVVDTPTRESDRIKSRGSEISTKGLNPVEAGAVSPEKAVRGGKKLPPKKRGFPVSVSGEQSAEIKPEIAMAVVAESPSRSPGKAKRPRIKRGQVSAEPDETPARSAAVVNTEDENLSASGAATPKKDENLPASETATPKTKPTRETRRPRAPGSMIRVDYAKSESPTPIKSKASSPIRKGNAKSRESEEEILEVKNETENKRGASRRLKKKALEKSVAVMSEDELATAPTPAKRPKSSAKSTPTVSKTAEPLSRPETPVSNTRGRGKRKPVAEKDLLRGQGSVESTTDLKSSQSNNTKISMRGRKARGARDSPSPSSVAHLNEATQSSLESQEIQAILSGAEIGASQSTPRKSFRSSSRAKKEVESIEKPIAKPAAAKKRTAKVDVNQTTIEEFLKPKSEPKIAQSSPRTRGRPSIRGRRTAPSRSVAHPAEKENAVEEVGVRMKRGNKTGPEPVASSKDEAVKVSPLRRGRSSIADRSLSLTPSSKTKHKILFTGINAPQLTSAVSNLGGTVTEKPSDCTALVTDKVRRTYKFLCAMAMAIPIVPVNWLTESEKSGRFLDTHDFLLQDPVEEAKFNFDLRRSLELAKEDRLLDGYTVILTPNTAPPPTAEMKGIIQACGGKVLARPPTTWPDKSFVISRQEDAKNAKKFLAKAPSSVPLVSVEFLLTGILRHKLNFEEHKLKI